MHRKHVVRRFLAAVAVAMVASGCTFLQPHPDLTRYYVLASLAAPTEQPGSDLRIGIGPLLLPDYLQRYELVQRGSKTELHYADHARWAESLSDGLGRTIAENVALLLGTDRVIVLPALVRGELDFTVLLEIAHFEPAPDGHVNLVARWTVHDPAKKKAVDVRLSQLREKPAADDWRARTEAMSRVALRLSEEIATTIRAAAERQ